MLHEVSPGIRRSMLAAAALLAVVVALFAFSAPAFAVDRLVNPASGCNNSTGSPTYCTITAAVNAAVSGDTIHVSAGTFAETGILINKNVSIIGAGSGSDPATNTIVVGGAANLNVFDFRSPASGTAATPMLFSNTRVQVTIGNAINFGSGTVQYIKFDNVALIGDSSPEKPGGEIGLKIAGSGGAEHFTFVNSSLVGLDYGWYMTSSNVNYFRDILVENTAFTDNNYYGVYSERMADATFRNVSFNHNGFASYVDAGDPYRAGLYVYSYYNGFGNMVLENVTATGNGLGAASGYGVSLGVWNSGPAGNTVTITGGSFTDNEAGIRIGHSTLASANMSGASISGNAKTNPAGARPGLVYTGPVQMMAEWNWWGASDGPSGIYSGSGDAISGNVDADPFMTPLNLYVATTGNDSNSGMSPMSPKLTIQAAIDSVSAGGTVHVANGIYAENLTIAGKSLSLIGESRNGVVINAVTPSKYGIDANGGAFTFKSFTLNGLPETTGSNSYGLKVSGATSSAVVEDVKVSDFWRSQFDFNGLNALSVKNVEASGSGYGNGVALTDVKNAVLDTITTSGNVWGGVRIASQGQYYPPGTSGVSVQGLSSSGEPVPAYVELNYFGSAYLPVLNVSVPGFDWAVTAFRPGTAEKQWVLFPSQSAATTFAAGVVSPMTGGIVSKMLWPVDFTYPAATIYAESVTKPFNSTGPFTFDVPIMLSAGAAVHSLALDVNYPPLCVTFVGVDTPQAGFSASIEQPAANGKVGIAVAGAGTITSDPGALQVGAVATLHFDAAACSHAADLPAVISFGPRLQCGAADGLSHVACTSLPGTVTLDFNSDPSFTPTIISVDENVTAGSVIQTFVNADPDGDTLHYTLGTGGDNAAFTLTDGGVLSIIASPDFETKPSYTIQVTVTDGRGGTFTQTVTVTINNLNDNAPVVTDESFSIPENSAGGAAIGTLHATDADGATTYTFSTRTDCADMTNVHNEVVSFATNGAMTVSAPTFFDFETHPSFAVCVGVSDGANASASKRLTVNLTNVNEPATDISISKNEWAAPLALGATGATFSTSGDPDAGSSFTYALVAGSGDTDNAKFNISGNALSVVGAPLTAGVYSILVSSTDNGTPAISIEKSFVLTVYGSATLSLVADNTPYKDAARTGSGNALSYHVTYAAPDNVATNLVFRVSFDKTCLDVTSSAGTPGDGYIDFTYPAPTAANVAPTLAVKAVVGCADNNGGSPNTPALLQNKSLSFASASLVKGSLALAIDATSTAPVTVIDNSIRGNCNADAAQGVNAADYVATVLEIFDNTGLNGWLDAPVDGFDGSPYGCDSSQNGDIAANDIACTVHESFGSHCTATPTINPASVAGLDVAAASADAGATINVPVSFDAQGAQIGALVFTLKLDPAKAAFDATDADGDGNPDAVHFNLVDGQSAVALYDAAANKINVAVFSVTQDMQPINGNIASVSLKSVAGGDAGLVIESASASTVDGVTVPVNGTTGGQSFLPSSFYSYLPMLVK